jgi:polyprenyl-phospho-N-acetylgalactosaminyl synthase
LLDPKRFDQDGSSETACFQVEIPRDLAIFEGHFPDFHILPGVVQLHDFVVPCVSQVRPQWGEVAQIQRLKFLRPVLPADMLELTIQFQDKDRLATFTIRRGDTICSSGKLFFRERHFRPCVVIPTFNNIATLRGVVDQIRSSISRILVVNDGSAQPTYDLVEQLEDEGMIVALHRPVNGGKGAAVKDGFKLAHELGFTHVLQVDADGQHDLSMAAEFLAASEKNPSSLILGYPIFGPEAQAARVRGRKLTNGCVAWQVGRGVIKDAMIGFRVYPLEPTLALRGLTDRMDFDIEIAVRLVWANLTVCNLPIGVRYLTSEEGGISSFQPFGDNARISWLHTRLCVSAFFRRLLRLAPFRSSS